MGAKPSSTKKLKNNGDVGDAANTDAFDASTPCYSFKAVLEARSAYIFMNPSSPGTPAQSQNTPLLFCDNLAFTLTSAYMWEQQAAGKYCTQPNGEFVVPCLSSAKNQLGGPALTEDTTFGLPPSFVGFTSTAPSPAQYTFYNPPNSDRILIYVNQLMETGIPKKGFLTFAPNSNCAYASTSQVVLLGDMPPNAGFGVLWTPDFLFTPSGLMLTYTDDVTSPSKRPQLVGLMGVTTTNTLLTTALFSGYNNISASATASALYYGLYADSTQVTVSYNAATMQLKTTNPGFSAPVGDFGSYTSAIYPPFVNMGLWQCVAGVMNGITAQNYMTKNCMGTTTYCLGDSTLCTPFTASDGDGLFLRGPGCQVVALVDEKATDAAYQTLCAVDYTNNRPLPPDPANADVLSTMDCACINYSQSTYKLPYLKNRDFNDFTDFLSSNGLPLFDSGDPMCWWPPCTQAVTVGQPFSLSLSANKMQSITGPCPDTTLCINEVTAAIGSNAHITETLLNDCYQGPAVAPPPPVKRTSTFDKLLHNKALQITAGIVGVLVLLFIIYLIMNPKLPSTTPQQYGK
jgi:hypothetical protein